MRSKVKPLDRNRSTAMGAVLCEECWLAFDPPLPKGQRSTEYCILNYSSCKKHRGMKGYNLPEKLREMDKMEGITS